MSLLAFCGNDGIDSYVREYLLYYLYFLFFSKFAVNAVSAVKSKILLIFLIVSIIFLPTVAVTYLILHPHSLLPRVSGEIFL